MKIVVTAGGTGGHIFPAEALAMELMERGVNVEVMTDFRFQNYSGKLTDLPVHILPCSPLSGSMVKKAKGAFSIMRGYLKAKSLLKKLKPDVVVGFGGYPSFPAMLAASTLKLPTIVHEQNSTLGRTNRFMLNRVTKVATSFEATLHVPEGSAHIVHVGNPVRQAVRALANQPFDEPQEDGPFQILVIGGSQGASVFADVVPKALLTLPDTLQKRLSVSQQCRLADLDETLTAYRGSPITHDIQLFFQDIPTRLKNAHLVIARSGASTVAELALAKKPSILVPYPHATDNHQQVNAESLEGIGAAWVMPQTAFTVEALANKLEAFMLHPKTLTEAALKASSVGIENAASRLADIVEELAEK